MPKTLSEVGPVTEVAEIVYHGEQLILPNGMEIPAAITLLKQRQEYLQQEVNFNETFDVFPWDGAYAINAVLTKLFGWSPSVATPGFFGPNPPSMITIDIGPNEKAQVPWGAFSLPGVKGLLQTDINKKAGRLCFALTASVQRKDEATIKKVFEMVREELKTNSIYRGKAIKMRFRDDSGRVLQMPEPSFLHTDSISEDMVIYSDAVQDQIRTNLFTPITRVKDCIANGMAVKRGVLLGGIYGTGKTLAAHVASKLAVDNGITYLYIPRADELNDAIEFAKQYQSPACVIFCEDIDRALSGQRSVKMDDILNIVDGIDSKNANLIVVLTTNALDNINPAMLRPGRLDAVIEVTPPDAKAVGKLLRLYGGNAIKPETNLDTASNELAGNIPAVIAEVVKRAKLAQLSIQPAGTLVEDLTEKALTLAAYSMKSQLDLLKKRSEEENAVKVPDLHTAMSNVIHDVVAKTEGNVDKIATKFLQ